MSPSAMHVHGTIADPVKIAGLNAQSVPFLADAIVAAGV
ncbi:hypothetical protein thalar_03015 [Litoreibacter arenae DSM 19593]|uniref:Uncharacterized protein n=1 Tax=Litoreibacter arenae DSM 19593 TaxID=1123360 RepID=S9QCG3_9RHOB|nr:hypothetical protein thalar_03015 [Litoreibacter arenae DSM 19593]